MQQLGLIGTSPFCLKLYIDAHFDSMLPAQLTKYYKVHDGSNAFSQKKRKLEIFLFSRIMEEVTPKERGFAGTISAIPGP